MAFRKKFRITKTNDEEKEEILVEDMEEEKKKEEEGVIDMEGETMDAAEYKEVTDMCKDLGFENIKDALAELKELKGAQDEDEKEKETKDKEKEEEEKSKTKDAAIPSVKTLEEDIATIENPERKAAAIASFAKVKDALSGLKISTKDDVTKLVLDSKREKDEDTYEDTPEFANYGNVMRDMYNPHTKK